MKRKLSILILLALSAMFLIGCNPGGSDLDIDYDQVAEVPSNLVITGKVLTWNTVDEAKAYIIYVNGQEKTTVKTNRYDFSSVSGSVLIFQVMSDAERGYQDSGLSASLAYVANHDTELVGLTSMVEAQFINCPDGFPEALLEKGMVSADFTNVQTAINELTLAMSATDKDIISLSNALQAFIDKGINYEALINAFLLYVPSQINTQIADLNDDIDTYQEWIDDYGANSYYQQYIDDDLAQIELYQNILDTINSSKEEIVLSATHTLEYFVSIIDQLDSEFFTNIKNLSTIDNPAQLDTDELILVKDEISSAMLDNIPSLSDMTVLFELLSAMSQAVSADQTVLTYPTENAAQILLSIEFFARMIDTIDANYINSIKGFAANTKTYQVESLILTIKYFDTFQKDNDGLIKEMRDVLSFDQQKAMYQSYLNYMGDVSASQDLSLTDTLFQVIDFEDVFQLKDFAYNLMDPVLEWFSFTNGDILRYIDQQNTVYDDVSYTVGAYNSQVLSVHTLEELCGLLLVITGEATDDDGTAIAGVLSTMIPYSPTSMLSSSRITKAEYDALVDDMKDSIDSEIMKMIGLIHSLCDYALSENFFDDFITVESDINQYAITKYGANYNTSTSGFSSDPVPGYARLILVANLIDGFMTRSNTGKVEDIANMIFDIMNKTTFLKASGMSSAEVATERQKFFEDFDTYLSKFHTIKGYDAFDLSTSQEDFLDSFVINILN